MPKKTRSGLPIVSKNLRRIRKELGITQEKLAERSDLSSVRMIESGKNTGRVSTLLALADALDTTISEFFVDPSTDMPDALKQFLDSPEGREQKPTQEEICKLMCCPFRRAHSPDAYYWALKALRSRRDGTTGR